MAPSSLPHQEDPNKISLECGTDARTAEHIWLDVASCVQIYSNSVTSDKLLAYPGIFNTGIFLEVVGDKILRKQFSSLMETKGCVVFLASYHLQNWPGVWLPRRAPRRWGRRRSGGSGPGSGSPPGPAAPPASPCHAPCHAVTRCHEWSLYCLSPLR